MTQPLMSQLAQNRTLSTVPDRIYRRNRYNRPWDSYQWRLRIRSPSPSPRQGVSLEWHCYSQFYLSYFPFRIKIQPYVIKMLTVTCLLRTTYICTIYPPSILPQYLFNMSEYVLTIWWRYLIANATIQGLQTRLSSINWLNLNTLLHIYIYWFRLLQKL